MGAWDSPWHFIVLAVVLVLLFGSRRLPDAARALGQSMRIFKSELRHDGDTPAAASAAQQPLPPAAQQPLPPAAQPPAPSAAAQPVPPAAQPVPPADAGDPR